MSIDKFIATPLDSAVLETKKQYAFYFKLVKHAFSEVLNIIKDNRILTEQEQVYFKQYTELLLYSLEALRVKYLYDNEEKMRIDLTESGFPNYMEFRYLVNDLDLRKEFLHKLPKVEDLKEEFLETLFEKKEPVSSRKLHQAASIVYYSSIDNRLIFKRFVQGKISKTTSYNSQYIVSWSFYDITYNRPFICFLYFDYDGKNIDDYKEKIYDVLKISADRSINLDTIAYLIDKKLPKIHPKRIKKIDVGPLHNIFAKDENIYTHTLLTEIANKTIAPEAFSLSLSVEEAFSKGSFKEGSFFNKQELQIWKVEKPKNYLFAPHKVTQLFYNKIPDVINLLSKPPFDVRMLKEME